MGDLFSTFNPETVIMGAKTRGNWLRFLVIVFTLPQIFWLQKRKTLLLLQLMLDYLSGELTAIFGSAVKPGLVIIFLSMFLGVFSVNLFGLIPYVFTPSRHLSFTLSLAMPVWLGYILVRLMCQFNHNMAHIVPEGTPRVLIPLMVVIESVSLIIRPFTLAVRLAANMIAGHLLLSLLGGQGYGLGLLPRCFLITGLSMLIILECAVACIQAYVFIILSGLYSNEHNSRCLNNQ